MRNARLAVSMLLLAMVAVAAGAVPNTIVNGDFATPGVLAPWTAASGSPTVAAGACTLNNASIQQTVATTAGGRYYLAFDAGGAGFLSYTAAPSAGGANDASGLAFTSVGSKITKIFVASSASTTLTFSNSAITGSSSVDNVLLVELTTNALTGSYAGTVAESVTLTDHPLAGGTTRKVRAIVDADGKLFVLDGATVVCAGILFSDGTFILRAGSAVHEGTATLTGKRVEISFSSALTSAQDEGGNSIPAVVTTKLVLKRTGNLPAPK